MPIFKAAENKKCGDKGGFKTSPRPTLAYITNPKKAAVVSSFYLDDNKNYAKQFAIPRKFGIKRNLPKAGSIIISFITFRQMIIFLPKRRTG